MTAREMTIRQIDDNSCEFTFDRKIASEPGVYSDCDTVEDNPIVEAIMGVPGITSVEVDGVQAVVKTSGTVDWQTLAEQIGYAVDLVAGAGDVGPQAGGDEEDLFEQLEQYFERQINPSVAQHGGKVELIDVEDRTVVVRMMGGCQGCGMANVTLKQGIEASIKKIWPAIEGVSDITDHAGGSNPYYEASKK